MKRLYKAGNLQQAQLIADLLRDAGISCHIMNESLQTGVGELPFTEVWPEIWLHDDRDSERALTLIRAFEQQPEPAGDGLTCRKCREHNPPGFEVCWNCGRNLT